MTGAGALLQLPELARTAGSSAELRHLVENAVESLLALLDGWDAATADLEDDEREICGEDEAAVETATLLAWSTT